MSLSLVWPLGIESAGFQSYADDEITEAVNQGLKMLLLTRKGEYVMDNNFGVGMYTYLFELEKSNVTQRISAEVKKQIARYMPYVIIKKLDFSKDNIEKNVLSMRMEYSISENALNEVFEMSVSL